MKAIKKKKTMMDSYLQILGLADRPVDFSFLSELTRRHVANFAFSSVTCQLGEELPLDFDSLYERIVLNRRGGYCFEQNGLMFGVLEYFDFFPKVSLARVIYKPTDTLPSLTHRISIIVHESENYVIDVGFGFLGPACPVPMSGTEVFDGQNIFRIKEILPGEYHLQVKEKGEFHSLYQFELTRYVQADCELGHFFSHRHKNAQFVNNLVVSKIMEGEITSLVNLTYRISKNGTIETFPVKNGEELKDILVKQFGIWVTLDECYQLYERLVAKQDAV